PACWPGRTAPNASMCHAWKYPFRSSSLLIRMISANETGRSRASPPLPDRRTFLGERGRALAGVLGGEDVGDQGALAVEHFVRAPVARLRDDGLGRAHRQRAVGRDGARH